MIAAIDFPQKMTPEEYLAWEEQQEFRHEYIDGEIYAMTGGTLSHNRIYLNLYTALRPHLRQRGCDAFVADVKLQAANSKRYFYPDLVVTCNADDLKNNKFIEHPTVIVEVLSPSTSSYDKNAKLRYYRQIPSVQEYLLIHSDEMFVEMYQRQMGNMWFYRDYSKDEILNIPSIDFNCSLEILYENVMFEDLSEWSAKIPTV